MCGDITDLCVTLPPERYALVCFAADEVRRTVLHTRFAVVSELEAVGTVAGGVATGRQQAQRAAPTVVGTRVVTQH